MKLMAILFDFQCPNGHTEERMADSTTNELTCRHCSEVATKIISPVKIGLDPISGSSWKATRKWTRQREQKIQQERKANS